jgi:phospholipase C
MLILPNALLMSAASAANSILLTSTHIKHLVIIFQENVSFDHYFATYPNATNQPFHKSSVNGLNSELLTHNPNLYKPFMIPRSKALTCSNDHSYTRLQEAYNGGLLDKFVQTNSVPNYCNRNITMGYFDGSTVTALWNYAQHFAMSDNYFGTTFGPFTVGALNLVSGQTHGATPAKLTYGIANGTVIGDPDP